MSEALLGQNLIFLISQPRAGSTLLQRILGAHGDIHTTSEPWLMLQPFYALRPEGYTAEYEASTAQAAVHEFLHQFAPNDQSAYVQGVRRMYSYLYQRALDKTDKLLFLDKTPRYYLIIPELAHTFPHARFIILLRNPLAVMTSILQTWKKENWFSLYKNRHDLLRAPQLLLDGIDMLGPNAAVVHYEQLIGQPQRQVERICQHLQLPFEPQMLDYQHHNDSRWRLGDQHNVYQNGKSIAANADKWQQALDDPQIRRLAGDYLELLGPDVIKRMGYDYAHLDEVVRTHRPRRARWWPTLSLSWLISKPAQQRSRWSWQVLRLTRSLQRRGLLASCIAAVRSLLQFTPGAHGVHSASAPQRDIIAKPFDSTSESSRAA